MTTQERLLTLLHRANRDLDDWHDFFEHTKSVWRGFQIWADAGQMSMVVTNLSGRAQLTERDLVGLCQYYLAEFLAPMVLQRLIAIAEGFIFDLLAMMLRRNPAKLGAARGEASGAWGGAEERR